MGLRKRCAAIFLAVAMAITGAPIEGLALEAEAAPNNEGDVYWGLMLTRDEFNRISYAGEDVDLCDLVNYEARYTTGGNTVTAVLENLNDRETFYWQDEDYGEDEERPEISGDDGVSKKNERYYAIFLRSQSATAEEVAVPEGVNGVILDSEYYDNLPEEDEPGEDNEVLYYQYTYKDLTVKATTALTFWGRFSDITIKYGDYSKDDSGNEYPIVMRGEAAGSIEGIAEGNVEKNLFLYNARLYGISGFNKTLFLPQTWRDDDTGEEGIGRWMYFDSPTGEEKISFESICAAEINNEEGTPWEIEEEEEATSVDLHIRYHEGYIPEISGKSNLGISNWKDEETGDEGTDFNSITLMYYDVDENSGEEIDHILEPGDQVVDYKNAEGWSSNVWYNSPEVEGEEHVEYWIDAKGRLFRAVDKRFSVRRYQDQENDELEEVPVGEDATIAGALQALAYDSELNPDNAYVLELIQDWDNKAEEDLFWETDLSNLCVPENVRSLRLTAEGQDMEDGYRKITGILDEITVNEETELELTGFYKGTGDMNIRVSGGGKLNLDGARINGNVLATNLEVTSRGETAVKSLNGMTTLGLSGDLTVEKELRFAENGQINVKEEREDAAILARNGAKIEIPKADFVWDEEGTFSNRLSIFEEVKDGNRPQIIFSGTPRVRGEIWSTIYLNYQKDDEEEDESGWKPDYWMKCPAYIYVPTDEEGEPDYDVAKGNIIQLNDKVYHVKWDDEEDYEEGEGTTKIELDGHPCTLIHAKLEELDGIECDSPELEPDTWGNDDIELIPYKASAVEDAAAEDPGLSVNRDPYTDDWYYIDIQDAWNCEYQEEDETVEYYASGIDDITDIVVLYGMWAEDGEEYYGRSCIVYPVQQFLHYVEDQDFFTEDDVYTVEEDGEKRYAMYLDGPGGPVKNSHYVSDTLPDSVQEPISLEDAGKIQITAPAAATYTGSAILGKPVVKRISDGYVLVENTDYTLTYQNHTNAGTASVTITAKDGSEYTGHKTVPFTINPKSVSGLTVNAIPDQYYTGEEIRPSVTVLDGSETLTADDYSVSYSKNTNIGTADITITGKGNYTGDRTEHFNIVQNPGGQAISLADASKIQVTTKDHVYSGSAISEKPVVKRISDNYVLKEGTDYTLKYDNNTNAGKASVTITAVKDSAYAGERTVSFTIQPKSVSGLTVGGVSSQYVYTGKAVTPAVTVSDGNKQLTSNDYSIAYSPNINIGEVKITITGKGNYTGTLTKNFTITVNKNAVYTVGDYKYKIVNAAADGKGTVSVTGLQKKTLKKLKIADTVTIGGAKFAIVSIEKNAFKGCKKATDATIGKNVTAIGDNAFSGCTSLKKVTIGKSVKTIGKSAFEKDSKLKSIKIQSTVLKKVGKNALKKIHKKAVISVPKKQLKSYKKILKGKGQASSVKIK